MAIPKIIHYCWFGPKPIPELELKCMKSWKKFLSDYKLMFWNEKTFDIDKCPFVKQAYDKNYFAFVSDFVRAHVLNQYGGVYLDTDLEILSNFTDLFDGKDVVLGFENKSFVGTAIMASVPQHKIFNEFVNYYNNLSFVNDKGDVQITANPSILASILKRCEVNLNGEEQFIDGIKIYKRELFFPKKIKSNEFKITDETVTIHHFEGSWLTNRQKRRGENIIWIEVCRPILRNCKDLLLKITGQQKTKEIENKIRNWLK
jgi:mannosyltransferase OCH1-like enzyme